MKLFTFKSKFGLIFLIAVFFIIFANGAFYRHVLAVYPLTLENAGFLASLVVVLLNGIIILLTLFSARFLLKPVAVVLLILSSLAAYFMDSYGVVIDHHMIDNILRTDTAESLDLLSAKMALYVLFLGILPAWFVIKVQIPYRNFGAEFLAGVKVVILVLVISTLVVLPFTPFYASFIREHKPLRYFTNPTYYIYSLIKYSKKQLKGRENKVVTVIDDSPKSLGSERELVVLVIGETVRADHFSLNGYAKPTNPLLSKETLISFRQFYSCGTSTAESVPCMFSLLERGEFSKDKARTQENLLDVLKHAGVHVLWRDNNSDSKDVALRVTYQNYKTPENNPVCDEECRDEGMLVGLDEYIRQHPKGDFLIVLHQMGNHGPAYYKRYPKAFEKFTPVCKTNQLEKCTGEEINNAYDNAILYTDYFLSKVIDFLKAYSKDFDTAMFYVSDHGESLGENGLYLHGLPYIMAPDAQKHVAAVLWLGDGFGLDITTLKDKQNQEMSHDYIFHTVLGLLKVKSKVYKQEKDIFEGVFLQ
ncbi:phosphoethanolamine transferase [methane-oxidizing endosymbiont of Gigantopelta aegis]|uniref:phosphoethanolamine transferase n=1 Tax=methane-oxidizing endosymbiont of Gigantopelta aegis TaxID=2794938 RepID=UPI0018DE91F9|nr:phosphoethanolamine--lipid A transferase [methane-oxidizing endosymbiont of Gigantopelta aegis]